MRRTSLGPSMKINWIHRACRAICLVAAAWIFPLPALAATTQPSDDPAPLTLDGDNFLTIPGDRWKLVWHDEFNESQLDASKWTNGLAWMGDDGTRRHHSRMYASYIADDDVVFRDGMLNLLTRKTDVSDPRGTTFHYTEGFIQTDGKFNYTYGYCEIRAKVPTESGRGLWPAFWMLSRGWPPEDDVAEFWTGRPQPHFHQGFAYRRLVSGDVGWTSRHVDAIPQGFHEYGMEWGPGYQLMNLDGKITVRIYGRQVPSIPMYLILNSGVAADTPPDNKTVFPNVFQVQYLRVYSRPEGIPLHNAGFEDADLSPWYAIGKAKVVRGHSHDGAYALSLSGSPASAEQTIYGLRGGTTYRLTAWTDPNNDGPVRLGVQAYGYNPIYVAASGSGYRQLSLNFTTGQKSTSAVIELGKTAGTDVSYFDDVAIAKVNQ